MKTRANELMNRPVSDIMTKKLITVLPTDPLQMVNDIFEKHNIHHIPVVRHLDMVGIISKTDFYQAIHGARLESAEEAESYNKELFVKFKAEDLMTKHVVKIGPEDKIGTAAEIFLENYFHAIPVVNDENELVGIVSSYDIVKLFFQEAYPTQELTKLV
jgi:acetoin utilization protein AcuB